MEFFFLLLKLRTFNPGIDIRTLYSIFTKEQRMPAPGCTPAIIRHVPLNTVICSAAQCFH